MNQLNNKVYLTFKDDEPFNKLDDAFEILDTIDFTISIITPEKL